MVDVVSKKKRSQMMAGISGKNTRPEMIIRKGLHARGLRYGLHANHLSGKPDLFFKKYGVVLFVNGCFWHCHDCSLFKLPKSNTEFWKTKLEKNTVRDAKNYYDLSQQGYSIAVVWECALKNKRPAEIDQLLNKIVHWMQSYPKKEKIEFLGEGVVR